MRLTHVEYMLSTQPSFLEIAIDCAFFTLAVQKVWIKGASENWSNTSITLSINSDTMSLSDKYTTFQARLTILKTIAKKIPLTVSLATKTDKIPEIFKSIPVPRDADKHWEVFNRRMDLLFGEDVRDSAGRLKYFRRGALGLDMVIKYIQEESEHSTLIWDLAQIKVDRLITEIETLMYVTIPDGKLN